METISPQGRVDQNRAFFQRSGIRRLFSPEGPGKQKRLLYRGGEIRRGPLFPEGRREQRRLLSQG
jgi:hypothetical protein